MKASYRTFSKTTMGSIGVAAVLALLAGCDRRDRDGLPEAPPPPEKPLTPRISPAKPAVEEEGARGRDATDPDATNPVGSNPYAAAADAADKTPGATADTGATDRGTDMAAGDYREAEADFKTAKGYKLSGDAEFDETAHGVKILVEVENAPVGKRGIHIHQKGDCSDIPGKSMGEHFSPQGGNHALPGANKHHLGDLGNIEVGKDGKGRLEITVPSANLKENDPMSLLGRALVIHEAEDKGTPPSGMSGKPIACAVIEKD